MIFKGARIQIRLADDCGNHPIGTVIAREVRKIGTFTAYGKTSDTYATYLTVRLDNGAEVTVSDENFVRFIFS